MKSKDLEQNSFTTTSHFFTFPFFIFLTCIERPAPPVPYTTPVPHPDDDLNHLVPDNNKEIYKGKYNYNYNEQQNKGNKIKWFEGKNSNENVNKKQFNTYSPFHQNQNEDHEAESQGKNNDKMLTKICDTIKDIIIKIFFY